MPAHPLLAILLAAADGRFPPTDGGVTFLPPTAPGLQAVVSFTAHTVVCTTGTAADFDDLPLDGYGATLHPAVLTRLASLQPEPVVGVLDTTLVRAGTGGGTLPRTTRWDDHHRVQHARALRTDVRVHGDERGLLTIAAGLAGRTELSIELADPYATPGTGRALVAEALALVPADEPVFAAVAPGNARSLRAFLACGFVPVGSEVIVHSARLP